ncbi:DUF4174 domain-containing protein [Algoriphagus sp. AK58]|uniref:DUF4174 domain-containing protein n=1 Tax=Algoriphagus sp. AK58 TaxID=1406877 RepID=UPI00164FAB31|nr:DUF4174 domain-containing protein [Algoriphagus sp. AK58]MBC6367529.1 hypothetical protein [Algoriphagus sp. AK58]
MYWIIFFILLVNPKTDTDPSTFVWKNRIIIYSGENDFSTWLSDGYSNEISDRKLLFFHFHKDKLISTNYPGSIDQKSFLKKLYPDKDRLEKWVLVGLDGEVKNSGYGKPSPTEIFKIIDAMPMRQSELRQGKNR